MNDKGLAGADAEQTASEASTSELRDLAMRFHRETGLAAEIAALIEPALNDMGFRLVRVLVSKRDGATVQVIADRAGSTITVDDCAIISRRISPLLDAHDPVDSHYFLEVSSPGIDRILVRPSDFEDWAGYEAKIELNELVDGRKRFRGVIEGFEGGEARIQVEVTKGEAQTVGFPVTLIHEAKLVLTDELIRASLSRAKAAGQTWTEGGEVNGTDLKMTEENDGSNGS